eukprot:jgi/Ulvmu1/9660/UM054_0092.1
MMSLVSAGEEGFASAPISKLIVLGSCAATFGSWIATARGVASARPFVSLLAFDTFVQLAVFCGMMYNCRAFERRVGSRKFGSFLAGGIVLGLMTASACARLWHMQRGQHRLHFLPFLCLPSTLCNSCPRMSWTSDASPGQQDINGNLVLLCAALLFMVLLGPHNVLPCTLCLLLGFFYQSNAFQIQSILIPDSICTTLQLGPGQFLGFSRGARVRMAPARPAQSPRSAGPQLRPGVQVDESVVSRIMAMGFQRDRAVQALRAAGNDIDAAIARLL